MASNLDTATTAFELTEQAHSIVLEAMRAEPAADELALWVEVRGVEGGKYAYDLYFQSRADADDEDLVVDQDGLTVVVPARSVDRLSGARLEFSEENGGGLVMVNPNAPTAAERAPGVPEAVVAQGLEGPLALRAIEVLERDVNPGIASHGGRADLVAMDEEAGVAYLALSGGCQGCAMSRMTLANGIEVALREHLPELTEVVDVTDHAMGANPFYAG
jgi:Fe/S biogenesis protein NfuA